MSKTVCIFSFILLLSFNLSAYEPNPYVDPQVWEELTSYFLPEDHPIKNKLDSIFKKRRVLKSIGSLHAAGFRFLKNSQDKIIVVKHDELKGFLIKMYLDDSSEMEWVWWKKRVDGSKVIANAIQASGYEHIFKVPKKWIYPLPAQPSPASSDRIFRKNFILVVEKMDILSDRSNKKAWKKKMNRPTLEALYTIIMENLLLDSVYADNTPFCKDGKIAFIDTEHTLDTTQPIPIWAVGHYLSEEMLDYWEHLLIHGVP